MLNWIRRRWAKGAHAGVEMELWEHLGELRARIIRCLAYVAVGTLGCWLFSVPLQDLLVAPVMPILAAKNGGIIIMHPTEAFLLRVHLVVISGLIVAVPFISLELWGFIRPALTKRERKGIHVVAPLSTILFLLGVVTGYALLRPALGFLFAYVPAGWGIQLRPLPYLGFTAKMVLGFGVAFQLPIVLMFLAYVGLVTSRGLRRGWRTALVAIAVGAALITPGGDALTMMLMAAPLTLLYVIGIGLVKLVERTQERGAGEVLMSLFLGWSFWRLRRRVATA